MKPRNKGVKTVADEGFHLISDLPDVSELGLDRLSDPKFDNAVELVLEGVEQDRDLISRESHLKKVTGQTPSKAKDESRVEEG